jgi:hypothetical protein|tara:strand:+ start:1213 stop:4830 length:3618 start_codon:yes stop_codon:yes gene_type:complete
MATDRFGNEIAQPAQPLQSGQDFDRFGNPIALKNDVTEDQEIGAGTYAAALGTEIAIAESIKFAGATVLGPIGYVGGALGGGALGSIQAQRMTNPNGEISIGRVIADSFINLLPASKLTKGAKTVGDVAKRTAGAGAAIGVGGVTIEKGIDEGRAPTIEELGTAGLTAGVLGGGLGFTGAKFNEAYNKIGGLTPKEIDTVLDPRTKPDVIKSMLQDADVSGIRALGKSLMRLQKEYKSDYDNKFIAQAVKRFQIEALDDKKLALDLQQTSAGKQFVNEKGLFKVTSDEKDYYMESVLREAISADELGRHVKFYKETNDIAIDIGKRPGVDKSGIDVNYDVNQYLRAKHAIKYNKENAASFGKAQNKYTTEEVKFTNTSTGRINTKKIKKYLSEDGASGMSTAKAKSIIKNFEQKGLDELYKPVIKRKKFLSDEILEIAKRGGLISDDLYKDLRKKYPDYVPLNRVFGDEVADINTSSYLQEVRQTGVRAAVGSKREVMNLDQNLIDNLSTMIIKANTNKANQAFLKMVEDPLNKNVVGDILKTTKEGSVRFKGAAPVDDPNTVMSIYDKGQKITIKFKDAELAEAFKGMPRTQSNNIAKIILGLSRGYISLRGQLLTRFNVLEFPFTNKIRDLQETFINNMAKFGVKKAAEGVNPVNLQKSSMRLIANKILKGKEPSTLEEKALYKMHDEFKEDGGSTGGVGLYSRDDVRKEIEGYNFKIGNKNFNIGSISKDQAKGKWKQAAQKIGKVVDEYNEVFEDSSRFTAYRLAREKGSTRKQSAIAARNASFDPLKQGRSGQTIRSLYLFANPALQSSRNIIRSLATKKVFLGVMGSLIAEESARHFINKSIDEDYVEKLQTQNGGNYRLNKNFVFLTGKNEDGTLKYAQFPAAYPLMPLKVLANKIAMSMSGDLNLEDVPDVGAEVYKETLDSYNPVGGSLVPTPMKEIWSLYLNEDGLGRPIRPEWNETEIMHSSQNVFDYTAETQGGELAMALADTLRTFYKYDTSPENILYLYEIATGGPGRSFEQLATAVSKAYNGEELSTNDIPLLRRFVGESYQKKIESRNKESLRLLEESEKESGTDSAIRGRTVRNIMKNVLKAKPEDRKNILRNELFKNKENLNESVIKGIAERFKNEQLGITNVDKRIKRLPVKDRADFIIKEMQNKSLSEIREYILDLQKKKIITKDVSKEILANPDFRDTFLRKTQ